MLPSKIHIMFFPTIFQDDLVISRAVMSSWDPLKVAPGPVRAHEPPGPGQPAAWPQICVTVVTAHAHVFLSLMWRI